MIRCKERSCIFDFKAGFRIMPGSKVLKLDKNSNEVKGRSNNIFRLFK
jgi:hypothetical protein